ncbi:hypothetical protein SAMN05444064_1573 [Pseudomonas syringae]|nr:hypothetical protein SAMN05444514_1573 [Pseudomonas syringae]SFM86931.1 hypothetical protein SAMN05444064_1573 [Pseudomonas syringae]
MVDANKFSQILCQTIVLSKSRRIKDGLTLKISGHFLDPGTHTVQEDFLIKHFLQDSLIPECELRPCCSFEIEGWDFKDIVREGKMPSRAARSPVAVAPQ